MNNSKERREYEQKFYPLFKFFHAKNSGFKEKEAIFYNENKIAIFRGDDFLKYILAHKEKIKVLNPKLDKQKEPLLETEKDALSYARYLLDNKIIMRLERHADDPQKRWPKRLSITKDQKISDDSFYTWNLAVRDKTSHLKMIFVLVLLFLAFLYPIWPFSFKYAVFKVSLYILIFLLSFLIGRLVIYITFRLLGYSVWLFPNLDDETLGFWNSFKPAYSIERQQDGIWEIMIRLFGIIALGLLIYGVSQEPTLVSDFSDASGQTIDDILDWGKNKLEGKAPEPLHRRAIPDLSQIIKENDELTKAENEPLAETDIESDKDMEIVKHEEILDTLENDVVELVEDDSDYSNDKNISPDDL